MEPLSLMEKVEIVAQLHPVEGPTPRLEPCLTAFTIRRHLQCFHWRSMQDEAATTVAPENLRTLAIEILVLSWWTVDYNEQCPKVCSDFIQSPSSSLQQPADASGAQAPVSGKASSQPHPYQPL